MDKEEIRIEVNSKNINRKTVERIESLLSPEAIKENRIHAHGINVLGEGGGFYDKVGETKLQEVLKDPCKALIENAEMLGLSGESIENINESDARQLIQAEVQKREEEQLNKRKSETEYLGELGVDGTIKIHMCRGPFDFRVTEANNPTPEQMLAFSYVKKQLNKGRRVVIALGPGMKEYKDEEGKTHINIVHYVNFQTKGIEDSKTYFHIPTAPGELKRWREYCGFIAKECNGADFDVWIEANHNLDDNGHGNFQQNKDVTRRGEFSSEGRAPEDYAIAVTEASKSIKEINPDAKVGINIVFTDEDFVSQTLEKIRELGEYSNKIVDYVSFNPYRFGGKRPEDRGPRWNNNLDGKRGEYSPKGRFDWSTSGNYEEDVVNFIEKVSSLGIKDIRIGESGWPKESLSEEQRASYNLRGWLLDRYLSLPESPWALTSEGEEFSFVNNDGEKTPTYWAYRNFNKIFTKKVKPSGEIDTGNKNIICKIFKEEETNNEILALWMATEYSVNTKEEPIEINLFFENESEVEIISQLNEKEPLIEVRKVKEIKIKATGKPAIIRKTFEE